MFKRPPLSIVLAAIGFLVAIGYLVFDGFELPAQEPIRPPATKSSPQAIVGVGMIEASDEAIRVAPYTAGRVAKVFVSEGDVVTAGDPLYQLETDELSADVRAQQALVASLQSKLTRLAQEPRPESIPPLEAAVARAKVMVAQAERHYNKLVAIPDPRARSQEELDNAELQLAEANATLNEATANLNELNAGAWQYETDEVRNQLAAEREKTNALNVRLAKSLVRAPIDGTVLSVNLRVGEYVTGQSNGQATNDESVILGNLKTLQVRVDVDEITASRVMVNMPAEAALKGDSQRRFPLTYKRINPLMVPKQNLTGTTAERVDVRVLQLLYTFNQPEDFPVYVGQQVDVYLMPHSGDDGQQATKTTDAPSSDTSPDQSPKKVAYQPNERGN